MGTLSFWNYMGAVGVTYICFYNYDKYLTWLTTTIQERDVNANRISRAKQHASQLLAEDK
ncbi:hypothetical protein T492DRAFT_888386 [Pavlovales sp. CCMP2436]|nr:hypothetical protein T492DRAFT_888386 [Pavlovales sp. CCMP2436]